MLSRLLVLLFVALASCGSDTSIRSTTTIGVDPTWFPLDFGELQPFVNGYAEDLLIELAQQKKIEFMKMGASWDDLVSGLREKKFDAILSSLPPYSFNQEEFEFSQNFLDVGPVIVTQVGKKAQNLDALKEKLVGVIQGGSANTLLMEHPTILARTYTTIPDLLQQLNQGAIDAVLLEKPFAVSYVNHLYSGMLQIASDPLTDAGLHLVTRKGESMGLIELFNSQTKNLKALQNKWNLAD